MKYYLSILFLLYTIAGIAQDECIYINKEFDIQEPPNRIFNINGYNIGLYGWENNDYEDIKDTIFSESVIYNCKSKEVVYEWWALQNCSVKKYLDTLIVTEYYLLATGKQMSLQQRPFYITKIFADDNSIKTYSYYLLNNYHYNREQISIVINNYQNTSKEKYPWNSEKWMQIAYQLQWAYISGSEKAGELLEGFERKYGPFDGATSEEFSDIMATYQHIKEIKNNK